MESTVRANIQYPTFKWLAAANIAPSNTTNYALAAIEKALTNASGALPYVRITPQPMSSFADSAGWLLRPDEAGLERGVVLLALSWSTARRVSTAGCDLSLP